MIFSPLDYALWVTDVLFSALGTFVVFSRHRSAWPLWIFLAWWTAGDVIQFVAHFSSLHVYALAWFGSALPKFALEFVLTAFLCGVLIHEHPRAIASYSACLGLLAGLFIAWRHQQLTLYVPAILKTELACCGAMAVVLAVGWIGTEEIRRRQVEQPWRTIIIGVVLLVAVQAVSFGLQVRYGVSALALAGKIKSVGEILGLGMLLWAGIGKKEQAWILRLPIGKGVPNRTLWLDSSAEGQIQ